MSSVQLSLFGGFQATNGEKPLVFHSNKVRALLAYLAVEAGRPHTREALAALLWGEYDERTALTNLRNALSKLNQTLSAASGLSQSGNPPLTVTRMSVRFDYPVQSDVAEFDSLLTACEQHSHTMLERCYLCLARLTRAVELYRGDFLAGIAIQDAPAFDEWQLAQREQRHMQTMTALRTIVEHYATLGNYADMERYAQRIVALEPWHEEAHLLIMQARAYRGDRQGTLAQYEACRRLLQKELGQEPETETRAFYKQVKAGVLPQVPSAPLSNFPVQTTPFVGYQTKLAQVIENLLDPDCRLLTLLGAGGVGKTRLGMEAARRVARWPEFRDGVCFVPFTSDSSPQTLLQALAKCLDLSLVQESTSALSQITDQLRDKQMLLLLDGWESASESAARSQVGLIKTLLDAAPGVKCLVTSRAPLYLRAEWRQTLPGLAYPPMGTDMAMIRDLSYFPAVELFIRLAERVRGAPISPSEMQAVAQICALTQGIPLAIEIAAAWTDRDNCEHIADALKANLDFLISPMQDTPPRHKTLRAVFETSWALLSPDEQKVLTQLSVFRGGFTVEAVTAVVSGLDNPATLLGPLADKSLLLPVAGGRFDCHRLTFQFASEKLQGQAQTHDWARTAESRHSAYYLTLAEDQELSARSSDNADLENIRAAWQWASTHEQNLRPNIQRGLIQDYLAHAEVLQAES